MAIEKIKILGAIMELYQLKSTANNSFYVKFIATFAPIFFGYIISILAIVVSKKKKRHT